MLQMEEAIKTLAGRSFKLFLKKHSGNKIKGILSGGAVTAILQSSSVVSLIVLAFVGAGVIPMRSAIAMVFGANLGTTVTGWLVALVGFKVEIEQLAFPLIGAGTLMVLIFEGKKNWKHFGQALLGLGFLFLGLEFMKTSVDHLAENFDLSPYVDYSPFVFLLIGMVLTAIIQSSSASMVITLSALYSNIIPLESAAAMVIGSDLGTTATVLVGGLPGLPAKKRVALAHFIFNLVTDLLAFLALDWLLMFVTFMGVSDPLIALVLLHSTFNAFGLILFYPFINYLADFLESRFKDSSVHESKYIRKLTPQIPEAALQALDQEVEHLFHKVFNLVRSNFEIPSATFNFDLFNSDSKADFKKQYKDVKQLEGEMFQFYTGIQQQSLDQQDSQRLSQLINVIRDLLHAAKGAKDVHGNLAEIRNSTDYTLNSIFNIIRAGHLSFYEELEDLLQVDTSTTMFEDLIEMLQKNQVLYEELSDSIYQNLSKGKLSQVEISTVLNINRWLFSSRKALIMALKDYRLNFQESIDFQKLPASLGF